MVDIMLRVKVVKGNATYIERPRTHDGETEKTEKSNVKIKGTAVTRLVKRITKGTDA